MTQKPSATEIHKKLLIAEQLYELAYKTKYYQLKQKYPDWTDQQIHEKVIELIDKGCQ